MEPGEERCFLLSDLVPAGVMTEGAFVYAVRVLGEDGELAGAEREFAAIRPAEAVPAVEPAPDALSPAPRAVLSCLLLNPTIREGEGVS